MGERKAVLIAGPTASGKSALALERAEDRGGIIVNADSMQVYDVLRVVTARPGPDDLARAEHRLYGFIPPAERCSVGRWQEAVHAVIADPAAQDRDLIFVGGTGLYFEALENGMSDVPEIPAEAVVEAEKLVNPLDRAGRKKLLSERDPQMAAVLREPDPQRVVRALSVLAATGRSLAWWQRQTEPSLLRNFDVERLVIDVDRDELARRISKRFGEMFSSGAVDEVAALMKLGLPPDLPAMKAIGVREIAAWQSGETTREDAIERAVIATRQYAKRQRTWLRQRMGGWTRV